MTTVTANVATTSKLIMKPIKRKILKRNWMKIWNFLLDFEGSTPGLYQFLDDMSRMEFIDSVAEAKLTKKSRNKDRSKAKAYYRAHRMRILNKKKRLEKKRAAQKEVHSKMGKTPVKNKIFRSYPGTKNSIHEEEELKTKIADVFKRTISPWLDDICEEHKQKLHEVKIRRKDLSVLAENKAIEIMKELKLI